VRLFAALIPPADVVADLERSVGPQQATAGEDIRWSSPEQWHVTLAFLARVEEHQFDGLLPALTEVAAAAPAVQVRIAGAGAFPRRTRARVIWAGLDGDLPELGALAGAVTATAAAAGIEVPEGPFRGHLTLARLRAPRDVRDLVTALESHAGPVWTASEVTLMRSYLGARPGRRARHEVVAAFPLGVARVR
jgi:2'-5' RNA ligase